MCVVNFFLAAVMWTYSSSPLLQSELLAVSVLLFTALT